MRTPDCLSDLQIDRLLAGEAPSAQAHLDGCPTCGERCEALRAEREAFRARARPAAFADLVLARAGRRPSWLRFVPFTLAPVAGLAVLAVLLGTRPAELGERVKGAPLAVELFVKSGEKTERYAPERVFHAGDALQFVYSTGAPRWLTVLDVEEGGRAEVLYPPARVPAGARQKLDRSFVLDDGARSERIFLIFNEDRPDEAAILAAARAAGAGAERLDTKGEQRSFRIRR